MVSRICAEAPDGLRTALFQSGTSITDASNSNASAHAWCRAAKHQNRAAPISTTGSLPSWRGVHHTHHIPCPRAARRTEEPRCQDEGHRAVVHGFHCVAHMHRRHRRLATAATRTLCIRYFRRKLGVGPRETVRCQIAARERQTLRNASLTEGSSGAYCRAARQRRQPQLPTQAASSLAQTPSSTCALHTSCAATVP